MVAFLKLKICRKFIISVISSSQWVMSSVSTFWVIWGKVMKTHEAPDSWGVTQKYGLRVPLSGSMTQKAYKGYCQSVFSSTGYILASLKTLIRNLKVFNMQGALEKSCPIFHLMVWTILHDWICLVLLNLLIGVRWLFECS